MFPLAILFLIAAFLLYRWAVHRQRVSGLPNGRIIYVDSAEWRRPDQTFYDPEFNLAGRPDYLVQQGSHLIPVEVKSSATPDAPYESQILQLAAYCRLVQVHYGQRPAYGILHYPDRSFAVDYTLQLENELLQLIRQMQASSRQDEISRSHNLAVRCTGCGFRSVCNQALHE